MTVHPPTPNCAGPFPARRPLLVSSLLLAMVAMPLMTSCEGQDVQAEERSEAARELNKAREAFANYTKLEAAAFRERFDELMTATDRRIAELREKVANSETKERAEKTLAELEEQLKSLKAELEDIGEATGDAFVKARDRIGAKVSDWQERLQAAWRELVK